MRRAVLFNNKRDLDSNMDKHNTNDKHVINGKHTWIADNEVAAMHILRLEQL
jgi:hypothetical protein